MFGNPHASSQAALDVCQKGEKEETERERKEFNKEERTKRKAMNARTLLRGDIFFPLLQHVLLSLPLDRSSA